MGVSVGNLPRHLRALRALLAELSDEELRWLLAAARCADPALAHGLTVEPTCAAEEYGLPVERCCAVAYAVWKGRGLRSAEGVREAFNAVCDRAGRALPHPWEVDDYLERWDRAGRDSRTRAAALEELARECADELARRRDDGMTG